MARIPLVPADRPDNDLVSAVFTRFAQENREPIALYRALAHAPSLLSAYSGLSRALRDDAAAPRALRELVILRTAQCIGSEYEWSHHHAMALKAGVSEHQIAELAAWRESAAFDATQRAALRCAEEMHEHALSDDAFAELAAHLERDQLLEIVMTCAFYEAVARVIQALDLEVEPAYAPYRRGLSA